MSYQNNGNRGGYGYSGRGRGNFGGANNRGGYGSNGRGNHHGGYNNRGGWNDGGWNDGGSSSDYNNRGGNGGSGWNDGGSSSGYNNRQPNFQSSSNQFSNRGFDCSPPPLDRLTIEDKPKKLFCHACGGKGNTVDREGDVLYCDPCKGQGYTLKESSTQATQPSTQAKSGYFDCPDERCDDRCDDRGFGLGCVRRGGDWADPYFNDRESRDSRDDNRQESSRGPSPCRGSGDRRVQDRRGSDDGSRSPPRRNEDRDQDRRGADRSSCSSPRGRGGRQHFNRGEVRSRTGDLKDEFFRFLLADIHDILEDQRIVSLQKIIKITGLTNHDLVKDVVSKKSAGFKSIDIEIRATEMYDIEDGIRIERAVKDMGEILKTKFSDRSNIMRLMYYFRHTDLRGFLEKKNLMPSNAV